MSSRILELHHQFVNTSDAGQVFACPRLADYFLGLLVGDEVLYGEGAVSAVCL